MLHDLQKARALEAIRKAQPGTASLHIDRLLTNVSVAYMEQDAGVATTAFPILPVPNRSDKILIYDRGDFLRDEAQERASGTESAGGGYDLDTDTTFFCKRYAYHKDVDDDDLNNADDPIAMLRDATAFVMQKLAIKREKQWAAAQFVTGIWTNQTTPSVLWSAAGSTPRADILAGQTVIRKATGRKANTLVLAQSVRDVLVQNAGLTDLVKYSQMGILTDQLLAAIFDVDRVVVGGMVEATSAKGAATTTTDYVLGKSALLCYVPPSPSLLTPSAGYTISWKNAGGMAGMGPNAQGVYTRQFRMEQLKGQRVEAEIYYDMKKVADECGYFFLNAVA
jgi:hypothetical protein